MSAAGQEEFQQVSLKVESYDRVSGMLTSLLILVGGAVLLLFLVWLTTVLKFKNKNIEVQILDFRGRGENAKGYARDMEEPGMEEVEEIIEPAIEASMEQITTLISQNPTALDQLDTDATQTGHGSGLGDSRKAGLGGDGDLDAPGSRKFINYTTASANAYAKQLDFFKIKIAAIDRATYTAQVAANFSGRIVKSTMRRRALRRAYVMSWPPNSEFLAFDRQLLSRAGIPHQRKLIVHIMPVATMKDLALKEITKAGGPKMIPRIYKSVFGVRSAGSGYEYYVISQVIR